MFSFFFGCALFLGAKHLKETQCINFRILRGYCAALRNPQGNLSAFCVKCVYL